MLEIKKFEIANKAVRYVIKTYNMIDETIREHYEDMFSEAILAYLENGTFRSARNAVQRYVVNQIFNRGLLGGDGNDTHKLRKFHSSNIYPFDLEIKPAKIPIISLARLLYSFVKKKGRRGRRASALKALILYGRASGDTFSQIAMRYGITKDNAKQHYKMAWTWLRRWLAKNIDKMSPEQVRLFRQALIRKDALNYNSSGEYYKLPEISI